MARVPRVVEVHDRHVWKVTSGFPSLWHVLVGADVDCHAMRRELARLTHDKFQVDHATLQVGHVGLDIEAPEQRSVFRAPLA